MPLYDERQVLALTRDKAFEIQGLTPPPLEPPAAPRLLAIESPAAIAWQGSTGASSYDVERADEAAGPWTTVGKNVSDADVQYRPLFGDDSAAVGHDYYYRIVARNSAGDSAPSNVVGPVATVQRTLVDECMNMQHVAAHEGDVTLHTDNVRRTQEDAHRFELAPGAAIVYRVAGPIKAWRVYAFAESPNQELRFAGSADGSQFAPLAAEQKAYSSGRGDYGYLVPVLFHGREPAGEPTRLRIALPDASDEGKPVQISRVEIDYGP